MQPILTELQGFKVGGNNVSPLSDVELRNNITYICALGFEKKSGVKAIIDKLSAEYWKHKGYYNFTSTYKGSF